MKHHPLALDNIALRGRTVALSCHAPRNWLVTARMPLCNSSTCCIRRSIDLKWSEL